MKNDYKDYPTEWLQTRYLTIERSLERAQELLQVDAAELYTRELKDLNYELILRNVRPRSLQPSGLSDANVGKLNEFWGSGLVQDLPADKQAQLLGLVTMMLKAEEGGVRREPEKDEAEKANLEAEKTERELALKVEREEKLRKVRTITIETLVELRTKMRAKEAEYGYQDRDLIERDTEFSKIQTNIYKAEKLLREIAKDLGEYDPKEREREEKEQEVTRDLPFHYVYGMAYTSAKDARYRQNGKRWTAAYKRCGDVITFSIAFLHPKDTFTKVGGRSAARSRWDKAQRDVLKLKRNVYAVSINKFGTQRPGDAISKYLACAATSLVNYPDWIGPIPHGYGFFRRGKD